MENFVDNIELNLNEKQVGIIIKCLRSIMLYEYGQEKKTYTNIEFNDDDICNLMDHLKIVLLKSKKEYIFDKAKTKSNNNTICYLCGDKTISYISIKYDKENIKLCNQCFAFVGDKK